MEEIFILLCSCCCSCCCIEDNTNNVNNVNNVNKREYNKYSEYKTEYTTQDLDSVNVTFFYENKDLRVDQNINRIIFYEEYIKGYYNDYNESSSIKDILVLYKNNISNITNIINTIHMNKGLFINHKRWIPKNIWIL